MIYLINPVGTKSPGGPCGRLSIQPVCPPVLCPPNCMIYG